VVAWQAYAALAAYATFNSLSGARTGAPPRRGDGAESTTLNPQWIGQFPFIQIATPSRSSIDDYRNHENLVRALDASRDDGTPRQGRCRKVRAVFLGA